MIVLIASLLGVFLYYGFLIFQKRGATILILEQEGFEIIETNFSRGRRLYNFSDFMYLLNENDVSIVFVTELAAFFCVSDQYYYIDFMDC